MVESRIVWLRDPSAFPWVRVKENYVASREGWRKSWPTDGILIGYAELAPDVKSINRRFNRRFFHVRETDHPFGDHYSKEGGVRPAEAVDPLTIRPNKRGELTDRSRTAKANMELIHVPEMRLSDLEYEVDGGRALLVLRRPDSRGETYRCPFCGDRHSHGWGDGQRLTHCYKVKHPEVVALDGTRLMQEHGYVVRTDEIGSRPLSKADAKPNSRG